MREKLKTFLSHLKFDPAFRRFERRALVHAMMDDPGGSLQGYDGTLHSGLNQISQNWSSKGKKLLIISGNFFGNFQKKIRWKSIEKKRSWITFRRNIFFEKFLGPRWFAYRSGGQWDFARESSLVQPDGLENKIRNCRLYFFKSNKPSSFRMTWIKWGK